MDAIGEQQLKQMQQNQTPSGSSSSAQRAQCPVPDNEGEVAERAKRAKLLVPLVEMSSSLQNLCSVVKFNYYSVDMQ